MEGRVGERRAGCSPGPGSPVTGLGAGRIRARVGRTAVGYMARIRVAARVVEYSTTLPTSRSSGRRALATASSVALHLLLLLLAIRLTTRAGREAEARAIVQAAFRVGAG